MALELRQQMKLTQQLVMTPQLQQAIKLLQLSRLELVTTIQQEIEQNPLLEEDGLSSSDAEGDSGEDYITGEEVPAPVSEKTFEVNMDGNSSLSEINWQDYANEYEHNLPYRPAESSDLPSRLDILTQKPNLQSHLQWQINFADLTDDEKEIGVFIIGNLNKNGFLEADLDDITGKTGCDEATAIRIIKEVQELDPAGVAARTVNESLLLQLKRLGLEDSLAARIVRDHLSSLETKNYAAIIKATKHSQDDVLAAIRIVTNLDPFPGSQYSDDEPQYITPDVYVHKIGDEYVILLNDEGLPRLKLSSYYRDILKKESNASTSTKEYIQDKLRSATWMIKSIQQRQRTIYRVVESLVKFQKDFFERGVAHLRPLVLRDVAEDIEMHESTISRVTSNKYVHTPQGIFELKYFFNSSIEQKDGDALSSESVKNRIRSIIQEENSDKPLSDNAIAEIFQKEDIRLARRTVAKYREQIGILPSKYRKKSKLTSCK
ncbi:MAG: RNA polymerase factor sigma-54 [Proteobacteria bacterium]|nr:RNA polymerase factor sigma-54 [Pseudomonadota bacterium]MBU1709733.1 RNA polymerase factor sigma-54 [Pseudomonadota bacterium]